MDQFILVKLNGLVKQVGSNYDKYEFANIYHEINNFCTLDLSSFYLDFAKDILYIEGMDQHERRGIQTVLYESLLSLTKFLSPIIPHTADEVWEYIPGVEEESVQLTDMPEVKNLAHSAELIEKWRSLWIFVMM